MSKDKSKSPAGKSIPAVPAKTAVPKPVAQSLPVTPPLFRKIDWLTFGLTTLLVFIGYYLTLAPDLTLEDSGELATGSFYAGVPHPPGYPMWTIFTWLWNSTHNDLFADQLRRICAPKYSKTTASTRFASRPNSNNLSPQINTSETPPVCRPQFCCSTVDNRVFLRAFRTRLFLLDICVS